MDEAKMHANLAAAMGVSEDELGFDAPEAEEPEAAEDAQDSDEGDVEDDFDSDQQDTEEETTSEDKGDEDDSEPSGGPQLPYDQRMAIKAALAGDGLPEALIESLSPDQLQAYWAKRQQRDAAFDGMKEDLRKYKSSATNKDDAKASGAPTNEPDNPLPAADLAALADEFGEDEAQKIALYVDARLKAATEEATAPLLEAIGDMIDAQQRSRLSGAVPGGLDGAGYERVRQRAIELGSSNLYSDLRGTARQDALFDAALRLEYPDAPAKQERHDRQQAKRRNGLPSRSGRSKRAPDKLSGEELTMARALAFAQGKTAEEVREMYG
jgi:hypothetical protein